MSSTDYAELATKLRDGLRATFSDLLAANPDRSFYSFAIWTDDSLQFANAAANTEEGLIATVRRYNIEVDPQNNTISTRNGMRWSYGDWEFFPVEGEEYLAEINAVLQDNFNADEKVFNEQLEPLWQALLEGFRQLNDDGFFGTGEERSRITLLVVGHVPDKVVDHWVRVLNPPDVVQNYIDWDCEAPDVG
jgi:hypothetical protein